MIKSTPKVKNVGFDLTGFGTAEKFKRVLRLNKLRESKPVVHRFTGGSYKVYAWKGKGLEMRTGNNPITGMYSSPKDREPEKGYASYIGIRGDPKRVARLVRTIKTTTKDIKEYNPRENPFIW